MVLLQISGTVGRGVTTSGRGVTRGRVVVALVVALAVAGVRSFRAVGSEIIAKVFISDSVANSSQKLW